jgi:hypothetical protein
MNVGSMGDLLDSNAGLPGLISRTLGANSAVNLTMFGKSLVGSMTVFGEKFPRYARQYRNVLFWMILDATWPRRWC